MYVQFWSLGLDVTIGGKLFQWHSLPDLQFKLNKGENLFLKKQNTVSCKVLWTELGGIISQEARSVEERRTVMSSVSGTAIIRMECLQYMGHPLSLPL